MRTIKGFTLIEMIVVMTIIGIIMAMASTLLSAGFRSYFVGQSATGLDTQASIAMLRMYDELQQAVTFSAMNATNVTFTTTKGVTITYNFSGSTLTRAQPTTQYTMNTPVTTFSLTYYGSDFNTTASPTLVRAITITMTTSKGTESIPLINTVYLPNMR